MPDGTAAGGVPVNDPAPPPRCRAHGDGIDPATLAGRRLTGVTAAWYSRPAARECEPEPVGVWLHDDRGGRTRITIGSDWCLIVDGEPPHEDLDMGEWGRIEIRPDRIRTPFARHLGEPVLAAREEHERLTGRIALELVFPTGTVRCDGQDGDLRVRPAG
ncbi:hypothetical protein ACIHEI_29555 [Kitasatospora sp. NPDC051984]|uniref:hypothetical protein n=1 Tax=Kitasatospora sp. NPDC051984 TaxID=3364059 RepID=UPI0037CA6AB7